MVQNNLCILYNTCKHIAQSKCKYLGMGDCKNQRFSFFIKFFKWWVVVVEGGAKLKPQQTCTLVAVVAANANNFCAQVTDGDPGQNQRKFNHQCAERTQISD